MKKLFFICYFCLFSIGAVFAQDTNWKPRELRKADERSQALVQQFDREIKREYFHIGDVLDVTEENLQEIILASNDVIEPQALEKVQELLTNVANEYEQIRRSFPDVARAISVDIVITKFSTWDVDLGRGIEVYQNLMGQIEDEKTIQLYKQMIQHLCADYDSLLK